MNTPLCILVAEDEIGDVLLLRRAFEKAGVTTPVHFARDGLEVMAYLKGKAPFANPISYPLPALLLLDLGLPRVDGFELLSWLRKEPGLRHMVVVVFSASEDPEKVCRAYELGANSYIVKPTKLADLIRIVGELQAYWLGINTAPSESAGPLRALTSSTAKHKTTRAA